VPELYDGVDFVPLAMGLFGLAEIMSNLDRRRDPRAAATVISSLWPTRWRIRRAVPAVLRGTEIGSCSVSCPAAAPCWRRSPPIRWRRRCRASPPSSARARSKAWRPRIRQQCRRPDLVHPAAHARHSVESGDGLDDGGDADPGHRAGTAIISERPDLFWGMVASMWVGNLMLIIINLR
jgi:hypothetical protein